MAGNDTLDGEHRRPGGCVAAALAVLLGAALWVVVLAVVSAWMQR